MQDLQQITTETSTQEVHPTADRQALLYKGHHLAAVVDVHPAELVAADAHPVVAEVRAAAVEDAGNINWKKKKLNKNKKAILAV